MLIEHAPNQLLQVLYVGLQQFACSYVTSLLLRAACIVPTTRLVESHKLLHVHVCLFVFVCL